MSLIVGPRTYGRGSSLVVWAKSTHNFTVYVHLSEARSGCSQHSSFPWPSLLFSLFLHPLTCGRVVSLSATLSDGATVLALWSHPLSLRPVCPLAYFFRPLNCIQSLRESSRIHSPWQHGSLWQKNFEQTTLFLKAQKIKHSSEYRYCYMLMTKYNHWLNNNCTCHCFSLNQILLPFRPLYQNNRKYRGLSS